MEAQEAETRILHELQQLVNEQTQELRPYGQHDRVDQQAEQLLSHAKRIGAVADVLDSYAPDRSREHLQLVTKKLRALRDQLNAHTKLIIARSALEEVTEYAQKERKKTRHTQAKAHQLQESANAKNRMAKEKKEAARKLKETAPQLSSQECQLQQLQKAQRLEVEAMDLKDAAWPLTFDAGELRKKAQQELAKLQTLQTVAQVDLLKAHTLLLRSMEEQMRAQVQQHLQLCEEASRVGLSEEAKRLDEHKARLDAELKAQGPFTQRELRAGEPEGKQQTREETKEHARWAQQLCGPASQMKKQLGQAELAEQLQTQAEGLQATAKGRKRLSQALQLSALAEGLRVFAVQLRTHVQRQEEEQSLPKRPRKGGRGKKQREKRQQRFAKAYTLESAHASRASTRARITSSPARR